MTTRSQGSPTAILFAPFLALLGVLGHVADAQQYDPTAVQFKVQGPSQRLELIVNTSRILTLDKKIPKLQVANPEIVRPTPLSPNQVQIAALKPGVTQINLWDEDEKIHTIDVIVYGDARELQMLLETEFPNSSIKVRPLASSVVLSGYVDKPEAVPRIIRMAEDYYPNVINNITVGGVQTVLLHVKIMEVSRTKLRTLGFDWANINGTDFVVQSVSGLIDAATTQGGTAAGLGGDTVRFGVVDGANSFFGFIEALRQYDLVKILAEPTIVTVSGRPASFNVGGEFPILVPGGLGTTTVEYREFGTRVDFVPIVLGNGQLRLEVRPMVSEIDESRSVTLANITVPGLRTRWVDTAVEMRSGQTLALAGLIQERLESQNRGLPWLADLPWAGAAFRRVTEEVNEIELLVMVTPELVGALDPHEVPQCMPGTRTTSPSDVDLYWRGHLEVPKCCPPGMLGPQGFGNATIPGQTFPGPIPGQGYQIPEMMEEIPGGSAPFPQGEPELAPGNPQLEEVPGTPNEGNSNRSARYGRGSAILTGAGGGRPIPVVMNGERNNLNQPQNRDNPQGQNQSVQSGNPYGSSEQAQADNSEPGLIGPIGYDELD